MTRSLFALASLVLATVPLLADDAKAKKNDQKIDPVMLIGKWESKSDYSKSLPTKIVGVYEFTKDGKMNFRMSLPTNPAEGTKRMEGTYKLNGAKVEATVKVIGNKESEETTMEIVKLTDTDLHLKHKNGKSEEFVRIKEKK